MIIELKVSRGPDAVAGQILRYVNWVRIHLAGQRKVRGIIVAQRIDDRIRYAIAGLGHISAKEHEIRLTLRNVDPVSVSAS